MCLVKNLQQAPIDWCCLLILLLWSQFDPLFLSSCLHGLIIIFHYHLLIISPGNSLCQAHPRLASQGLWRGSDAAAAAPSWTSSWPKACGAAAASSAAAGHWKRRTLPAAAGAWAKDGEYLICLWDHYGSFTKHIYNCKIINSTVIICSHTPFPFWNLWPPAEPPGIASSARSPGTPGASPPHPPRTGWSQWWLRGRGAVSAARRFGAPKKWPGQKQKIGWYRE